ncbi:hypothetical protein ACQ4PT_000112 [Festuca glaucescens]
MAAASGSTCRPPWPDLPQELLGLVLARVPSHADRVRLRAVCCAWHSCVPRQHALPPLLPWLALPNGTFLSLPDGAIHRVPVPHDVCWRVSTGGALFIVQGDGTCSLTTPSPATTTAFPEPPFWFRKNSRANHLLNNISKAVVSDHLVAVLKISGRNNVFTSRRGGGPPWKTTKWARPGYSFTADIALFQGKLYVLTSQEELHLVEVDDENTTAAPAGNTLRMRSIPWDDEERKYRRYDPYANDSYMQRRYLVVSGDQLLMVKRMINIPPVLPLDSGIEKRTHRFRVFEAADLLNDGYGRWREVTTLTGRALFVSEGCSESIPAAAAEAQCGSARAREDCIYFMTEDHNEYFRDTDDSAPKNPFDDSGVYHMRAQTVTSLPLETSTMSAEHEGPWSSTWIFPET